MLSDAYHSKKLLNWRTVAILRELEHDIASAQAFADKHAKIERLMTQKEELEAAFSQLRVLRQRQRAGYGPQLGGDDRRDLGEHINVLRERLLDLDAEIAPLVMQSNALANPFWGLMMRTGNDKSLFARIVESHADVYTSRVSNLAFATPYVFLRSLRGALPHDHT